MSVGEKQEQTNQVKKHKKRCQLCNKKTLVLHECKCGMMLCLKHLKHVEHDCQYDYHKDKVLAEKVDFKKLDEI